MRMQAEAPTKSFPGAAQKDLAAVRGYYRLIDQPAESAVTPENILAPHREGTLGRMQGQATVLCIQDGTERYAVPGHQVLWEGYTRLAAITQAFERARRLSESSELYQKLRSDKTSV